jgi:DNA-binding LacI/PurR family transcriptional regulator
MAVQPRHQVVAQRICALIRKEGLEPGSRLPSERQLANVLGVRHATVRLANNLLVERGVLRREHGRGTFVSRLQPVGAGVMPTVQAIGYLAVSDEELQGYTLNQYRRLEQIARAAGCRVVFGSVLPHSGYPIPQSFVEESVAGLVVDGDVDRGFLTRLSNLGLPVVVAGNHDIVPGLVYCRMNVTELYRQLVLAFAQAGHENIWLVCEPLRLHYTREMLEGYRQGMREADVGPELVVTVEKDDHAGEVMAQQMKHALKRLGPRHAILFNPGGDVALANHLRKIGCDLSSLDLVAANGPDVREGTLPWTTALHWPVREVGELAPRMLLDLLTGADVPSVSFEPVLKRRQIERHTSFELTWRPS